MTYMQK